MHHSEDLISAYVESLQSRARLLANLRNKERLTLLIPASQMPGESDTDDEHVRKQWRSDRAKFSKSEVGVRYWPDDKTISDTSKAFKRSWCKAGTVRTVRGGEYPPERFSKIGPAWANARAEPDESGVDPKISLTMLPDAWIAFDGRAGETLLGANAEYTREEVEERMIGLACKLAEGGKETTGKLRECLTTGSIRVVKVSAAEFNPRYRGRVLSGSGRDTRGAANLLVHWAIAHSVSDVVGP
jgi:hypothetical protein